MRHAPGSIRIGGIGIVGAVLVLTSAGAYRLWGWTRTHFDPLAQGMAAYDRADWMTAADAARKRLLVAREDDAALRLLARSSVHLRRDQTATTHYRKLMTRRSANLTAEDYYLLGMALSRQHKGDDAVAAWEQGTKIDPARPELLDELARAYTEQNRLVEAATTAERLAEHPAWNLHASLMLGELRSNLNDPAGVVQALEGALQDVGKLRIATSAPSLFQKLLARNLLRLGQPRPARAQLLKVLDAGPDPEASWLLSRAELQDGSMAAATTALGHAGSYRSEHPLEPEPGPYVGAERCARATGTSTRPSCPAGMPGRSIVASSSRRCTCPIDPSKIRATPGSRTRSAARVTSSGSRRTRTIAFISA